MTGLVAWDELGEDRRELDREAVRAVPDVLAAAGMAIAWEPTGSPPAGPPQRS